MHHEMGNLKLIIPNERTPAAPSMNTKLIVPIKSKLDTLEINQLPNPHRVKTQYALYLESKLITLPLKINRTSSLNTT